MNIQDSRILIKRSTTAAVVPTIPASSDHTDGSWLVTDIYKGELFSNLVDEKVYTRFDSGIVELLSASYGFKNGGNSFGANASIGTNDAFDLLFRAGNVNYGVLTDSGEFGYGVTTPFANTHKSNKSLGNTSGSYAEQWQDSDGDVIGWLRNDGLFNAVNGYSQGSNVLLQESGSRVMMGSLTDAKGIDVYTGGIKVMWADYADFLNFDGTSGVIFKRNGSECLRFTSDGSNNVMLAQVPFYNNSDGYKTSDLFQRILYRNNGDVALNFSDMQKHSVSPTSPNRTVQISINGETIYLHGKTTND